MRAFACYFVLLLLVTGPARADVLSSAPGGFVTQNEIIIKVPRAMAWSAAVENVGQWWNASHTVAGDATRMSIDARPMGCFCEMLDGGNGVVHLTVTSVSRNVMLRMTGALGPLGLMGVNGNMTWEFFDSDEGTRVKFTYAVGGYAEDGLEGIAGPVDYVIGEALGLLKEYAEHEAAAVPAQ